MRKKKNVDAEVKMGPNSKTEYYEFELLPGDAIQIDNARIILLNNGFFSRKLPKFGIEAENSIKVFRLEIFARNSQTYQQELNINFGETLVINDDMHIKFLQAFNSSTSILLRIKNFKNLPIKKSFLNKKTE